MTGLFQRTHCRDEDWSIVDIDQWLGGNEFWSKYHTVDEGEKKRNYSQDQEEMIEILKKYVL